MIGRRALLTSQGWACPPGRVTDRSIQHTFKVDTPTCDVRRGRLTKRLVAANHTHTWWCVMSPLSFPRGRGVIGHRSKLASMFATPVLSCVLTPPPPLPRLGLPCLRRHGDHPSHPGSHPPPPSPVGVLPTTNQRCRAFLHRHGDRRRRGF